MLEKLDIKLFHEQKDLDRKLTRNSLPGGDSLFEMTIISRCCPRNLMYGRPLADENFIHIYNDDCPPHSLHLNEFQ